MKTLIKNFFGTLRRFKMATLLNVSGLSVAFAAFIVIMMQVSYDLRFDSSIPDVDNIYRINLVHDGERIAATPRPIGEGMLNRRYIYLLVICFVIAAPVAWYAINLWLQSFAYKIPMYWWVFAAVFLLVAALTSATVTFQSWRVANANPVDSIKTE